MTFERAWRARRSASVLVAVALASALLGAGCAVGWEGVQYCGDDEICVPCADDSECVTASSCCGETWFCYHRDEEPFDICDLGCTVPDPPPCRCRGGECSFP